MTIEQTDTPTYRTHVLQTRIDIFQDFVKTLQVRRNAVVEKHTRAKTNNKLVEEAKRNKQLDRIFKKIERLLTSAEEDINTAADELNKGRALFLIHSDGEVRNELIEESNGGITGTSSTPSAGERTADDAPDRGNTPPSTT